MNDTGTERMTRREINFRETKSRRQRKGRREDGAARDAT